MNIENLNDLLRTMVLNLIERGWSKTKVCKYVLGEPAQMMRFLSKDSGETVKDFGIKPLERIASLLDCSIHLVVLNNDNSEHMKLTESLDNYNIEFMTNLNQNLEKLLLQNAEQTIKNNKKSGAVAELVDNLLNNS